MDASHLRQGAGEERQQPGVRRGVLLLTPSQDRAGPPPPPDEDERRRALDPSRSFIVQAPAGSGKTELLIRRYLALLATVAEPEEIVAVTFTRKAAGEMRARVLAALGDGALADRWELAANPARLRIQTIDALCASLTRQMPLLARFGAPPETTEDAAPLYAEAARATLQELESDEAVAQDVARVLSHLDNDVARVEGLLAGMLARRDHWVRHLAHIDRAGLEAALGRVRVQALERLRNLVPAALRAELAAVAGYAFANLGEAPFEAQRSESWFPLAFVLLTASDTWRLRLTKNDGFPAGKAGEPMKQRAAALCAALGEDFRAALAACRHLPPPQYSGTQWEALAAIARLLPHALAQLKLVFQAQGRVDFTEVAQGALAALGGADAPTDLALALDYRIRHLLVDEFQDTSISQYELIAKLTAGWERGDGRTIFAVGDPMQSIYRFREAEVGEFLRTWQSARLGEVELERVRLTANFRSQAGIVDWVNASFARLMPAQEDLATGAVAYSASVPVHAALAGAAVEVHPFFDGDLRGEADRVAQLVAGLRVEEPAARIAVLVRNRAHLQWIVPRLKEAGIRFRAVEIEALGARPVVQDLLALTRALAHPADRVAWLALLRSPICGLTLADLCALAEGEATQTLWQLLQDDGRLSSAGRARLARLREALAPLLEQRLRRALRAAVEGAWLALGGPACVGSETELEDAESYLDALAAAEEAGALADLAAFEERLEKLWALPDLRAGEADLQIMTIHKAKGLQFDHVIVPGLGRAPRTEEARLFLWVERPGERGPELLVAPIEEAGADGDPIYAWLARLDAERAGHEAARLLYVAATRARRRLHLLGDVRLDFEGEVPAPRLPPAASLLAKLWPAVEARFRDAAAGQAPRLPVQEAVASVPPDQALVRLASGWRNVPAPAACAWQAPPDEARAHDAIEFSWAGETARHVGSVAHRWLQRMAEDDLQGWSAARIASLRARVEGELLQHGVAAVEVAAAAGRVLAALGNAFADERGRWLLGAHPGAATEHRITALAGGRLRRMIVDRTFTAETGERWIVDYKTSTHEGADLEAFLDRERERYAGQLARYAAALASGGGVRCGLFFPMLRGWRELSPPRE